eukprot:TRINITY_DN82976_c0_g1_i1.p1 TRINITY_DN82976_c0_g1~~TRINITY_DN82976_c0_g1_i1.p1  ORF type:complete len:348 (-),score=61.23 TRINITY_DN82976_c0_g1_i1:220-1263(-)
MVSLLPLSLLAIAGSVASAVASAGPCDIYAEAGVPCIAAHSMVRALYSSYSGPLYAVRRSEDNTTRLISVKADGLADAQLQEVFCEASYCSVDRIFDQSPQGNHLDVARPGLHPEPIRGVNASKKPLSLGQNRRVYAAYFEGRMGYRADNTTGTSKGDASESMYMVTSGKHYNAECCFDYGNAEPDRKPHGPGTMEAIYWGNLSAAPWSKHGLGRGPWVMADLEHGTWAGNREYNPGNTPIRADYVTAMLKAKPGTLILKGADAQRGPLKTLFEGEPPPHYSPMKKMGGIVLGLGGDNSWRAVGTFFEGIMTAGFSSSETDDAVAANIASLYAQLSDGSPHRYSIIV